MSAGNKEFKVKHGLITPNITASGNISSSGDITGDRLYLDRTIEAGGGVTAGGFITTGNITANGNISKTIVNLFILYLFLSPGLGGSHRESTH